MPPPIRPQQQTASTEPARSNSLHLRLVPGPASRTLAIIPCLNEEGRVGAVVRSLCKLQPTLDILVVDDGSTDRTADEARAAGAGLVQHPFNLGYGAALQTGYRYAVEHGYDRLVQLDGDGQHKPQEVGKLLAALDTEEVDLVLGSRFGAPQSYPVPMLRRMGIRLFATLTSALVGHRIDDPTSGFQAMKRPVFAFCQQDFYPYDYPDADILLQLHYGGFAFREVGVSMRAGPPGKSMHRGLRPLYYVYKLLLSLALTWISRPNQDRGRAR